MFYKLYNKDHKNQLNQEKKEQIAKININIRQHTALTERSALVLDICAAH